MPPQPKPELPPPPQPAPVVQQFTILVQSRSHLIEDGASFPHNDIILGEMGQGDLKATVRYDGSRPPRGRLTLEWYVDSTRVESRPVVLEQTAEYGNEPTPGAYRVVLKLNDRMVKQFSFQITPARQ